MSDAARPVGVMRRNPFLRLALLPGIAALSYAAYFLWLLPTHVPQAGPYVEVETPRCLGPDGMPVGEYGQPCPSGTTQDTIVIQSLVPTAQP